MTKPKPMPKAEPKRARNGTAMESQEVPADPPMIMTPPSARRIEKGKAVRLQGLQKAPYLNGKRGVVQRQDPRPAQEGRWEVEVRLDEGKVEVKSIKSENIKLLDKA